MCTLPARHEQILHNLTALACTGGGRTGGFQTRPCMPSPEPRIACVALVYLYEYDGVVLVRRTVEPQSGTLVLPGGFKEEGETEAEAAARETKEEASIVIPVERFVYLWQYLVREANILVRFYIAGWDENVDGDLPEFVPNDEASERLIVNINNPPELGFPSHRKAIYRACFPPHTEVNE